MKNLHVIILSVLSRTESRDLRIKLHSPRFKQTVITPMDNDPGSATPSIETAEKWCAKKGFNLVAKAEGKDCYYLISDTFKPLR